MQVEEIVEENKLDNGELFTFTDNQVLEGLLYKGHSNSPKVNDLVLRLQLV